MAQVCLTLTLETEAVHDALAELAVLREALIKRHGARFRALEHRIEMLADADPDVRLHDLGGGRFACTSLTLTGLLQDGRELGVI